MVRGAPLEAAYDVLQRRLGSIPSFSAFKASGRTMNVVTAFLYALLALIVFLTAHLGIIEVLKALQS